MVIGNVTRDPELRTIPSGQSVASFAVATNRRWNDKESGEQKEEVQFHEIVAWGKLAEIAHQIIHKGNRIYVEGRLRTHTWEGQDGARRERTEIIAENLINLSPKSENQASQTTDFQENQDKEEKPKKSTPAVTEKSEKKDEKSDSDEINLDEIPF